MNKPLTRTDVANACVDCFETPLIKALSEPARLQILRQLVMKCCADIKDISEALPQDRSVISRHLKVLEDAGIVRSRKDGRQVYYEIDGPVFAEQMETLATLVRDLAPLCCPGSTPLPSN